MRLAHPPANGPSTVEVIKTEEKSTDVNLATDLLLDAFRNDCQVAVIISNDADLAGPIRAVRHELGLKVGIVNPTRRHHSPYLLATQPTFLRKIRESALQASQFPEKLTDEHGDFCRPQGW
ncbi:NYN domain-containing protein [Thermoactinospora rubra]|uniref:NYN domain-containing protein n=1 Tax=Thermoactinospora rubra TaxID=1088767 RepID=UPI000A108642|nr:NYN domain-containing protein [Thermoactinospora rubra]